MYGHKNGSPDRGWRGDSETNKRLYAKGLMSGFKWNDLS